MENSMKFNQVSYIFMAIYLLGIFFGKGIRHVFPSLDTPFPNLLAYSIMVIFAQVGINFLPSFGYVVYKKQPVKKIYKLNGVSFKQLGWSLLLLIMVHGILIFIHYLTEIISNLIGYSYQMSFYPTADDWTSLIVLVLSIGIIPPVCEDLFFRGFLLSGSSEYGGQFAIFFTAFAFALFHDNLFRFGEIFVYAFFAGFIVYYTNSILPGIIIHILTNTSFVVGSYFMAGDLVMRVSSEDVTIVEDFVWSKFLIISLLGGISLFLSLKIIKKIEDLAPASVRANEKKNKGNLALYPLLNIPILIVITVFILRVFTNF